jgi:hypothetical protein
MRHVTLKAGLKLLVRMIISEQFEIWGSQIETANMA